MGYFLLASGLLVVAMSAGSLVEQVLTHNLWNVWGTIAGGAGGVGLVFAGRWLVRNRRQPFTPR